MADAKITALTDGSPVITDIAPYVSDPAGTPVTKKSTFQHIADLFSTLTQTLSGKTITDLLIQGIWTGWVSANETWTYESASTFSVAADVTTKYQKGDKIKWTQTTVKYGVIVSVGAYSGGKTIMTIAVNNDYTIANAAISVNSYSREESPLGFPEYFNYTPVWTSSGTAVSLGNGSIVGRYSIKGQKVKVMVDLAFGSSTTYGTGNYWISLPVNANASEISYNPIGTLVIFDSSDTYKPYLGTANYDAADRTKVKFITHLNTVAVGQLSPVTFASSDEIRFFADYQLV